MNDTISRQAAIKALNTEIIKRRLLDDVNDGMLDEFDTESILKALPSAQPGWIPCSEQMPKEKDAGILKKLGTNRLSDYVIATVEVKGERMTVIIRTHDGVWHWDKKYAFPDYKVVAWMPMPKPWEGGQDENN